MKIKKFNEDAGEQYFGKNKNMPGTMSITMDNLQRLSNSLIKNTYIRKPNSTQLMKVISMMHEDGSGKIFIVKLSVYDENKTYVEELQHCYRLT